MRYVFEAEESLLLFLTIQYTLVMQQHSCSSRSPLTQLTYLLSDASICLKCVCVCNCPSNYLIYIKLIEINQDMQFFITIYWKHVSGMWRKRNKVIHLIIVVRFNISFRSKSFNSIYNITLYLRGGMMINFL